MRRFWPAVEAAQADYERLREAVIATSKLPDDLAAARFARRGLGGLVAWPTADPAFFAVVAGTRRPAWTPYGDPRLAALASTYGLLLALADEGEGEPKQVTG